MTKAYLRNGTVQKLAVSWPQPAVWLVRRWDGPLPICIDDPMPRCREVVLRRRTLRYPDGFIGPMESADAEWQCVGDPDADRRFWLRLCARLWLLESLGLGAAIMYAALLHAIQTSPMLARCYRELTVYVEDGAPWHQRWAP